MAFLLRWMMRPYRCPEWLRSAFRTARFRILAILDRRRHIGMGPGKGSRLEDPPFLPSPPPPPGRARDRLIQAIGGGRRLSTMVVVVAGILLRASLERNRLVWAPDPPLATLAINVVVQGRGPGELQGDVGGAPGPPFALRVPTWYRHKNAWRDENLAWWAGKDGRIRTGCTISLPGTILTGRVGCRRSHREQSARYAGWRAESPQVPDRDPGASTFLDDLATGVRRPALAAFDIPGSTETFGIRRRGLSVAGSSETGASVRLHGSDPDGFRSGHRKGKRCLS
jgi:hypothetical protein